VNGTDGARRVGQCCRFFQIVRRTPKTGFSRFAGFSGFAAFSGFLRTAAHRLPCLPCLPCPVGRRHQKR